jgi:hypothetical protein
MAVETTTRPTLETRFITAIQWTVTTYVLCFTLGSGAVLATTAVTPLTATDILFWHPQLLPTLAGGAIVLGLLCGIYWPALNGKSTTRELELYAARHQTVKYLTAGLAALGLLSLVSALTVEQWLTNLFTLGTLLLFSVYTYTYNIGASPAS